MNRRDFLQYAAVGMGSVLAANANGDTNSSKPNILWIVVEDASPHIGCYGETAIQSPHIDQLATEGVRFENAFVTCPVCSPARSALVTGMYQTTIGSHNHRSQNMGAKAKGNADYYDSYALPDAVPLIGDLFREAGYFVCNSADPLRGKKGKTDYNFIKENPYDGYHWDEAPKDTPFFAQIQLHGGKWRKGSIENNDFSLPPYYPDEDVLRKDWNSYLASWVKVDEQVGQIVESLKEAGIYENTLIAFITDHGISHARGKQFLYEEGIKIPMILRFPGGKLAGTVRKDMALHIDLGPISLAAAGVAIPEDLESADLFSASHIEREYIVSARDRCDETIDTIRCVRTPKYKYIRNFLSYRPHLQRNQYKDGKAITQRMRLLHEQEALNPLQNRIFQETRPSEELYDLEADPHETSNLAHDPAHREILLAQRKRLYAWMLESGDPGLIPEPILEDLGRKHGSKYAAMQQPDMKRRVRKIINLFNAGERNEVQALLEAIQSEDPILRYWAATWLGNNHTVTAETALRESTEDKNPTVRLAAYLALCKLGHDEVYLSKLIVLLGEPNVLVGLYVMNAIEQTGILNDVVKEAATRALDAPYDGTQRYGKRLLAKCEAIG